MLDCAVDVGIWSPVTAAPGMIADATASALASVGLDGPWTYPALATRFEEVLGADGGPLAARVVALMPHAPFDVESLHRLLVDLPALTEPVEPIAAPHSPWRFGVPEYRDGAELADALGLTAGELDWFSDGRNWLRGKAGPLVHYRYRPIPKRVGVRLIEAPKPRLCELQRTVLRRILDRVPPHEAAHGFQAGRSVHTFAGPHSGSAVVAHLDLRYFFASIRIARVGAVFRALGYPELVAASLAGLCTTATPADQLRGLPSAQAGLLRSPHLPEGAPTSPALANLIARRLDRRLTGLAAARGMTYTRYADDLAFSGPKGVDVDVVLWAAGRIVVDEGFVVHPDKTRVARAHQSQRLAGLVVNAAPAVPRVEYDALRALLHNCDRTGAAAQNHAGVADLRAHVYGRIAWIGTAHPGRREKLLALADRVDWDK